MTDERLDTLLNEELDGTLSTAEEAELRGRLERDPEARAERERLRHLARTLETVGLVEPPAPLRERITEALRAGAPRPSVAAAPPRPSRRILGRFSWSPGLAYSFAAGLAVGCAVFALLHAESPGSRLDRDRLAGAMVESEDVTIDQAAVSLPGVEGMVTLRREAGRIVASVALAGETEATVEWSAGGASWKASHAGESRYSVDLGPAEKLPGEIRLSVRAGGASLEKLLSTRGPR